MPVWRIMPADTLGILLISGSHDRAHYAYVMASGAAAVGRRVVLFATNTGCHAVLHDWSGLEDAGRDAAIQQQGVAGLETLRAAARELGVRVIACTAGLRMAGLHGHALADGVEAAGVATFLEAVGGGGQVISL
jgi:peroxiredoxin family protein